MDKVCYTAIKIKQLLLGYIQRGVIKKTKAMSFSLVFCICISPYTYRIVQSEMLDFSQI